MKRVFFEVRWRFGWLIYRDGETDGQVWFTKVTAVDEAVRQMKLEEKSELVVKTKLGRICERRTWPRKSDPKGRG